MTPGLHVHNLHYTQQFPLETNFFNRKQTKLELTARTLECCLLADIAFRSIILLITTTIIHTTPKQKIKVYNYNKQVTPLT